MKKLFSILAVVVMMGFMSNLFAQISYSGGVEFGPRYDMKNFGDYSGTNSKDVYYMLKSSFNIDANIGDGWYGKVQLGHYGYAGATWTNDATANTGSSVFKNDLIVRPTVNFNQMFLGYKTENWGFEAGIIPVNAIANPMFDIHYLPSDMVDIPFAIFRLSSLTGAKAWVNAGPGKLNVLVSKDDNETYLESNPSGDVTSDLHDIYTFNFDYDFNLMGFGIQPALFYTYASESIAAPMTYGVNLTTPKFAGFGFGFSYAMTSNTVDGTSQYDGNLMRVKAMGKIGPGSLTAWYDMANRADDPDGSNVEHAYSYIHVQYAVELYKGDNGSVSIMPRWRYTTDVVDEAKDYSRHKFELFVMSSFK